NFPSESVWTSPKGTDTDGKFTHRPLILGEWRLYATPPASIQLGPERARITLEEGEHVEGVEIVLEREAIGTISVRVTKGNGDPLKGVQTLGGNGRSVITGETAADGTYLIKD